MKDSTALNGLDSALGRFERSWQAGTKPAIEAYLPGPGPDQRRVLVELIHAELELRLRAGEVARVENYLTRFPELTGQVHLLLEFLATEIRHRPDRPLNAAEYQSRFPQLADQLEALLRAPAFSPQCGNAEGAARATLPAPPTPDLPFSASTQIPGYLILDELGRGGMGVVYRARQVSLGRLVALKMVLGGSHAGANDVARFRAEAEAIAHLQHPNIVQIFDVGDQEGLPFFSMEFVEGGSLAQRLDGTPWPPLQAARLVATLASAVESAHRRGIIHRDLKPANVLLAADGTPKITDFGLAKRTDGSPPQTATGAVLGTPSYMAPEQAHGMGRDIGPPVDLYALGAILYELLTGRPPFRAATPLDTVLQVVSQDPVPPRRLQPKLPRDLETICLKCLEKAPARRYADAASLIADLGCFLDGRPIRARPARFPERMLKWARRRPAVAALSGVSLLLLLLGLTLVTWKWREAAAALQGKQQALEVAEDATRQAAAETRAAECARDGEATQRQRAEAAFRQARRDAYASGIALADRDWQANDLKRAENRLNACPPELRGWEWHYLMRRWHPELVTCVVPDAADITEVAFSPDSSRMASGSKNGSVRIWDTLTGRNLLTLRGHTLPIFSLCFSSDGRLLASAQAEQADILSAQAPPAHKVIDGVKVWDLAQGAEITALAGFRNALFSPDSKLVATLGPTREPCLYDARTGALVRAFHGAQMTTTTLFYSPNGRYLAANSVDLARYNAKAPESIVGLPGEIVIWDAATGREVRKQRFEPFALAPAFVNGGKFLVTYQLNATLTLWDTLSGALIAKRKMEEAVNGIAPTRDGELFVTLSIFEKSIKIWDARSLREKLALHGIGGSALNVNGDGTRLAVASNDTLRVYDASYGQEPLSLPAGITAASLAFSPDGKQLVCVGPPGQLRVWDLSQGRTVAERPSNGIRLAFSQHGKRLVAGSGGFAYLPNLPGSLEVWDATTWTRLKTISGFKSIVVGAAVSPDGSWVAGAATNPNDLSRPSELRIYDASGKELRSVVPRSQISSLASSPDGKLLASGGLDSHVTLWDVATGKIHSELVGHRAVVNAVAFSPKGNFIASGDVEGVIKVWERKTEKELRTMRWEAEPVVCLAFNREETRLASAGLNLNGKSQTRVWDVTSGDEVFSAPGAMTVAFSPDGRRLASPTFQLQGGGAEVKVRDAKPLSDGYTLAGHATWINHIAFRHDGTRCVSASTDGSLKVWNLQAATQLLRLTGHEDRVFGSAWRADGSQIASGGEDGTVRLWSAATGEQTKVLRGHKGRINSVAYSPDGVLLASCGDDGTIRLWDPDQGTQVRAIPAHSGTAWSVCFSPDGSRMASVGWWDGTVRIWDVASSRTVWTLANRGAGGADISWSPDGRYLATAGPAGSIRIWDPNKGALVRSLRGHKGAVHGVAFSPDGKQMVSGGEDRKVIIWDAEGGWEIATYSGHTGDVYSVAYSPDGKALVSGDGDGRMIVWKAPLNPLGDDRRARTLVHGLFKQYPDAEEVVEQLQKDKTLSESLRELACRLANDYPRDVGRLEPAAWRVVRRPGASVDTYARALRRAQAAFSLEPYDTDVLATLGAAQYRVGKFAEALETLTRADGRHIVVSGCSRPQCQALLALCNNRLGRPQAVKDALDHLRELMRSESWSKEPDDRDLAKEAESALGHLVKPQPEDAIARTVIDAEKAGWIQHDVAAYFSLWAEDASYTEGRNETPGPYDIPLKRAGWEALRRVVWADKLPAGAGASFENVSVERSSNEAIVRFRRTSFYPDGFSCWEHQDRLRSTNRGWKVYAGRYWPSRRDNGNISVVFRPSTWQAMDAKIEVLRTENKTAELLDLLVAASREVEAHKMAQEITQRPGATAKDWVQRSQMALNANNAEDALASCRRARQLDPSVEVPPEIAKALANSNGPTR